MVHTAKFAEVEFGGSGFMWGKEDCPLSQAFVDDMNQIGSVWTWQIKAMAGAWHGG